jgi:hypothetical protein
MAAQAERGDQLIVGFNEERPAIKAGRFSFQAARFARSRSTCAAAAKPKLAVTQTLDPKPAQLRPTGPE